MAYLTFTIHYHTVSGEQVYLCGSTCELGNFNEQQAVELSADGDFWSVKVFIDQSTEVSYNYFIKSKGEVIRREWGSPRKLYILKGHKEFIVQDSWKDYPDHSYLFSSVFTDSLFRRKIEPLPNRYHTITVLLNVICPFVAPNQELVICGECIELGGWNVSQSKPLSYIGNGEWFVMLDADKIPAQSEYKFVIVDKKSREAIHWEDGENRILNRSLILQSRAILVEMALVYHYRNFSYRGTGTAIPLFSLKSTSSFGIGDFADLRKMVDWIAITGQQLIQLLPVNDTTATKTWRDSYPYNAISAYALHPIYLGCIDFPLKSKRKWSLFLEKANLLNQLPKVDYEQALSLKLSFARELFMQDGDKVLSSQEYHDFEEKNEFWLFPYSIYCYLRDKWGTADFNEWHEYALYDEALLKDMIDSNAEAKEDIRFWSFLQYLLHKQFSEVKLYAHEKGVALKGDIPIGISRYSIDTWVAPDLYNMGTQTGAPPDDFSFYGQNWGFPTYNWQAMEKENYNWWVTRFRKMADYFDAYRIDHILGFFRIWEIPFDAVQGTLGYFSPALPFTVEEIQHAGIPFDEERMVNPFIHEQFLPDIFGDYTEEVKKNYLDISGWQQFKLKEHCNTQRKVKNIFAKDKTSKGKQISEGLTSLCAEVLFVRDPKDYSRFHPRITAQYTHSYRYLDNSVQQAFNRLYDDFFYHRHNSFWREQAMKKLPVLISSTKMMVCGEDLGMVPDCVPSVMQDLRMLSLEIERMPKDPNVAFTDLSKIPYLSVCTTSTHDMSPLRLWWTENRELIQQYYNEVLNREGVAPLESTPDICRQIIERHLYSSGAWVILPLQDWFSIDAKLCNPDIISERVNIPANPEHYWRYRMHISLDDLLNEASFNSQVKIMAHR